MPIIRDSVNLQIIIILRQRLVEHPVRRQYLIGDTLSLFDCLHANTLELVQGLVTRFIDLKRLFFCLTQLILNFFHHTVVLLTQFTAVKNLVLESLKSFLSFLNLCDLGPHNHFQII